MKLHIVLIILFVMTCPAWCAVRHVPGAYPTIQSAIDAADNGDTILVADGTYSGDGNRNIELRGKILTVLSQNGPDQCLIDFTDSGSSDEKGFYCHQNETNLTTIQGFTFTNSSISAGYCIYCFEASPMIIDCVGVGCPGGGVLMVRSNTQVIDSTFTDNDFNYGSALSFRYSDVEIVNCHISRNSAYMSCSGISILEGTVTISDSEIIGNTASDESGGGVDSSGCIITLSRCTIQGNSSSSSGGGVYCQGGNLTISGCTIQGNRASEGGGGVFHASNMIMTNCLIEDNHAQFGGGVFCDYNFADSVYGGSADTGNTFRNNVAAMGADLCAPRVTSPLNAGYNAFGGYHPSDYYVSPAEAFDLTGCTSEMNPILVDVYVSPDGSDSDDGLTPSTPFKTIRKALSSVYGTEEEPIAVHLLPGTYSSTQNGEVFPLALVNHVSIHGEDAMTVLLDAEQNSRVIFGYKDTTTLSDITVTGGKTEERQSDPFHNDGGGIYAEESSICMDRCIVALNSAGDDHSDHRGGGLAMIDTFLEMMDCIIYGNYAGGDGGGMHFALSGRSEVVMTLTDTRIIENVTDNSGGGLYFNYFGSGAPYQGSPELTGCTISGNTAYWGGGGLLATVFHDIHDPIRISRCQFSNNESRSSGSAASLSMDCSVTETRFCGNRTSMSGSVLAFVSRSRCELINCLLNDNASPSATIQGNIDPYFSGSSNQCDFFNTTIVDNAVTEPDAGSVSLVMETGSDVAMTNCILWNNVASEIKLDADEGGDLAVTYSCVRGGFPGAGNLSLDPGFTGGGDYHLTPDSPCVDTGTDTGFPETDMDGIARPSGGISDVGAYEFPGWPDALRIYVDMPGHEILSWDPFWCALDIWNPYAQTLEGFPLFVLLAIHDQYFFAPTFNDFDFYLPVVSEGLTKLEVIPEMYWPSGIGSVDGVLWIAAITDPGVTTILSNVTVYSFGWHD